MAFLRQQLVVLKRSAPARLRLRTADRLIFVWLYRLFPLWCMDSPAATSVRRVEYQQVRAETGRPRLVIRLSTLHPIFASVRCLGRVRA